MATSNFGVRAFLNLLLVLIHLYLRHKDTIDNHLAPALLDAVITIVGAEQSIREANPRGPDPFVPTNIGGGL
jgi:hypothetical protein